MRTNNIIPILLAIAIHLVPVGFFLIKKAPEQQSPSGGMPESIGLSGFSLAQKKIKMTAAASTNSIKTVGNLPTIQESPLTGNSSSIETGTGFGMGSGTGTGASKADSNLSFIQYSEPAYPPVARARGMEGIVKIKVHYDEAGSVSLVEVISSSGYKMLDESVKKSASLWKLPTGSAGQFEKTFSFKLKN